MTIIYQNNLVSQARKKLIFSQIKIKNETSRNSYYKQRKKEQQR